MQITLYKVRVEHFEEPPFENPTTIEEYEVTTEGIVNMLIKMRDWKEDFRQTFKVIECRNMEISEENEKDARIEELEGKLQEINSLCYDLTNTLDHLECSFEDARDYLDDVRNSAEEIEDETND